MPRRLAATAAALLLAVTFAWGAEPQNTPAGGGGDKRPPLAIDKLTYPPLHDIKVPAVVRATLPNGMKLLLVEDHELPVIQLKAMIRGGRVAEPQNRNGLVSLFAEVLRSGGTASMKGDDVDVFLERIGAEIESDSSEAYTTLSAKMLTSNLDQVLPLYAEFMTHPAFAQDKLDLAKTQSMSAISRRNDDVMGIARRESLKLVYGAGSPYARQVEYDDVEAIGREDMVAFHREFYRPDEVILAAWGDFQSADMQKKLAEAFAGWKAEGPKPQIQQPFIFPQEPSVNYIEKKDVEQTFVVMGELGLRLDDPDYPAVAMLSDILGGGFSSRLFVKIRTQKGLAYGAGGWMNPGYDHPGAFFFFTSTKPSTTHEAMAAMLEEIKAIREAPVSDRELKKAKEGYLNGYAFDFDSTGKIINRLMTYDFYGYPPDFNTKLRDAVEKVTKTDILRVAQKRLDPSALTMLAIGKGSEFDQPLSTFGKVTTIDITIPEPKPKEVIPDPTPETLKAGTDLLLKTARAAGEQALKGLKEMTIEGATTVKTPMGEMEIKGTSVLVLPNRLHADASTPMGTVTQVVDGERGWFQMGPAVKDLPESAVGEMRRALYAEAGCALLLKQVLEGKLQGQALGKASFEGKDSQAVVVRLEGQPVTLYLTPDGLTILGLKQRAKTQEGPQEVTEVFDGWQVTSGLKVPMISSQKVKGEVKTSSKLSKVTLNASFSEDLFKRPPEPKKE